MSCQGKPVEMADIRTPEQKEMIAAMLPLILGGIGKGATPFGGQLSAPPDPSMLNAMNMMSMMGGQGPYQWPGMQTGPYSPPPGMTPGGGGGGGNRPNLRPFPPPGDEHDRPPKPPDNAGRRWWDNPDPYAPPGRPYIPV